MELFIHWHVDPTLPINFYFFSVQWYGVMWMLSIFGCFYLGRWILAKENLSEENLVLIIQYIFIGAIIGARLGQVFFYDFPMYRDAPMEIFKIWKGGLSSHGGVIGGVVGIWLFLRRHKEFNAVWLFDRVALIIYLPAALIRLGNLFNSELYGKVTNVPWAFIFYRDAPDQQPRHPVVLYESICYFILLIIITQIYRRMGNRKAGFYTAFFFTFTFTIRFLLEFMKEPEKMIGGMISNTQLLSIPLILLGIILFIFTYSNKAKQSIN